MSGLLALLSRDGAPVAPESARRLLETIAHRGRDGCDLLADGWAALGHQHHWTTPEELGERQPATSSDGRLALTLDGRIDNRDELAGALGIPASELGAISDAALVLRSFERWGEGCFERLLGPFAVIVADRVERRLVCARDPLGGRSLFYGKAAGLLAVGSEEQTVLALPGISRELDERSLAATLAVRARPAGRTMFRDVAELPQGHLLRIDDDGIHTEEYWRWRPTRTRLRSDAEYARRFRELLVDAVRCRLRTPDEAGVLMSGGLDSASVAAVAAQLLGSERPLTTVSWVFDELHACDERRYMESFAHRWSTRQLRFTADDGWPLRDASAWPYNPNLPIDNAYRILKDRAYATARSHGVGALLTGGGGDQLYGGAAWWLVDQLASGRLLSAAGEVVREARRLPVRRQPGIRRLGSLILYGRRPRSRQLPPAWLTRSAAGLLETEMRLPAGIEGWRRPDHAAIACSALSAAGISAETFHSGRHGIELRHPYRDRRLVEFMLSIPADQLYRDGMYKHVLRVALAGRLPEPIRRRTGSASLLPLYRRGLEEREDERLHQLLGRRGAIWRRYVEPDHLHRVIPAQLAEGRDGAAVLVPWYCAFMELWRELAAASGRPALELRCA